MSKSVTYSTALKYTFKPDERANIHEFLRMFFPVVHTFDSDSVPVDRYMQSKLLARYRERNAASNITQYIPGKGETWTPPILDEQTPIDFDLANAVIVGLEANAPATTRHAKLITAIRQQHDDMFIAALVKQAADILAKGKYQPQGKGGVKIGQEFDFGRDADCIKTAAYNANPLKQFSDAYNIYASKNGPKTNLVFLVGGNVLGRLQKSKDFMELLKLQGLYAGQNTVHGGNTVLPLIVETMIPECPARAKFYCFDEGYEDEAGAFHSFIDPEAVILTSLNSERVQFYAGIPIVENGQLKVFEGEMVSDILTTKNPDSISIRSQSRPLLIPGNPNHSVTVISNG